MFFLSTAVSGRLIPGLSPTRRSAYRPAYRPASIPLRALALAFALVLATGAGAADRVPMSNPAPDTALQAEALPADAALGDLVHFAMGNNPEVAAAYHRWRAATARVPQAGALPEPQFGLGIVLDQVDADARYMGERYSISQMFPWFGKLGLREDMAATEAAAAARAYESARLGLLERVARAWFEYAWLHQAADTARENLQLMQRLESVARARYRAGEESQADVTRAQVELGRLDNQWRSLQDQLEPAAASLNAVLGRSAHAPLPARPAPPSRQAVAPLPQKADQVWLERALRDSPGLAEARHQIERERHSVALARKAYYPDITLGLEYARDGSARMARMDGGGADMLVGMVSVSIPIRRRSYDAGVGEAEAQLAAADRRAAAREQDLEARLKRALFDYRDGERRMQLYGGTLVPKARQSLAVTERAYGTGDADFSDLVDAQRALLEFRLAHERAAADRGQARARIDALLGEPAAGDES